MRNTTIKTLIVILAACRIAAGNEIVHYELYKPQTADYKVYDGQDGSFAYNGRPSVEFFEDNFFVVWQANAENKADVAGRRLYLSTSKNLITWTKPVDFLVREAMNPSVPSVVANEMQGYPQLYKFKNKALWCIWCVDGLASEKTNAGVHLSILNAGSKLWSTTKIFDDIEIAGKKFYAVPTQKPVEMRSSKIILPVKLCSNDNVETGTISMPAFLYSVNEGKNWALAGNVSMPENSFIEFDNAVHQQKDGKVRVFSLADYRTNLPPANRLMTTIGSGTEIEDELKFESNLRPAGMDTTSGSLSTLLLSSKRYAMVIADTFAEIGGEGLCYNPAIFFSRTGNNDFTGGFPFAIGTAVAHPQLLEYDGKLYIVYAKDPGTDKTSSIALSWVELPKQDKNYIFGRSKDIIRSYDVSYTRTKTSSFLKRIREYKHQMPMETERLSRKVLALEGNTGAGLDIEPVDILREESIEISMSVNVPLLQDSGELTLFCIGDTYPLRIVMPSGRPGDIYISAPGVYRKISQTDKDRWFVVSLVYEKDKITCRISEEEPVEIPMPGNLAAQRFYIGNNCMTDSSQTNTGSVFFVDIESVTTKSNKKSQFTDY